MGVTLGRLGIAYSEFLILSPREFLVILDAFNRTAFDKYKREMEDKRFWHVANMNFQMSRENQITDPKRWLRFDWETLEIKLLTAEEAENKIEIMSNAWGI